MKSAKQSQRPKRSERLTAEELAGFKQYIDSFLTIRDCAEELDVNRDVIGDILERGTARTTTLVKIRKAIGITA